MTKKSILSKLGFLLPNGSKKWQLSPKGVINGKEKRRIIGREPEKKKQHAKKFSYMDPECANTFLMYTCPQ